MASSKTARRLRENSLTPELIEVGLTMASELCSDIDNHPARESAIVAAMEKLSIISDEQARPFRDLASAHFDSERERRDLVTETHTAIGAIYERRAESMALAHASEDPLLGDVARIQRGVFSRDDGDSMRTRYYTFHDGGETRFAQLLRVITRQELDELKLYVATSGAGSYIERIDRTAADRTRRDGYRLGIGVMRQEEIESRLWTLPSNQWNSLYLNSVRHLPHDGWRGNRGLMLTVNAWDAVSKQADQQWDAPAQASFNAAWPVDLTEQRRAQWNAEEGQLARDPRELDGWTRIRFTEHAVGCSYGDLKRAIGMYGLDWPEGSGMRESFEEKRTQTNRSA